MAQIVTITNPLTGQPAQVDQLDHTAQQIDDATARALEGGAIDQLLAGKAPSGYGLGTTPNATTDTSLNSLINNGWYYLYRNNTDGPDNVNISDAILFVSSASSDLTKVQRLTLGTQGMQGYELRRVYNNSSWLPWEWVNPPMKVGVEYRTTERYNGKPVYVKAIATGAMPSASGLSNRVKIDTGILSSEVDSIVRWGGTVTNGGTVFTLPTSIGSNQVIELNGFTHPYNSYVVYVESSNDKSDYSGTLVFAYTKKAD